MSEKISATITSKNNELKTAKTGHPLAKLLFFIPFFCIWFLTIFIAPISVIELFEYSLFSALGVLGAIFANSTGAGGGVVFIPMFNQLGFTSEQAIATSFGIQCFGMTAGAITWWRHYRLEKIELKLWQGFKRIIVITTIFSIAGIWTVFTADIHSPSSLHHSFSYFSLILGLFIVFTVLAIKPKFESSQLRWFDYVAIGMIGYFGGILTAWLSVGVGEILAIYLILRRFDVIMAVASAVVVSAFTVWSAIAQFTIISFDVYWQVLIFAGPGAVIGGILAKTLVGYLSAVRLKLFFAFWLLVIGFVGVII